MASSPDRYEWRAFGANFGIVEQRLRARAQLQKIAESQDIYVLSRRVSTLNVKLRNHQLDRKRLVANHGPLELWSPMEKLPLPLSPDQVNQHLLAPLGAAPALTGEQPLGIDELLHQVIYPNTGLVVVHLFKRRWHFTLGGCVCEMAELLVNGAALSTVCIEATDPDAVIALAADLRLDDWPNRSYVAALRQVVGLTPP
ncbi:MAG: hypothetical protein EA349_03825 [Halomonadaceae bacterium]|nr:MAG: hypothetical protein EA349_03825 [Halomonadaceae bacterium]